MEGMVSFWNNKKVFITGHTGFKGGWLAAVLSMRGAKVVGYSIDFPTRYNAYSFCSDSITTIQSDICDYAKLYSAIQECSPDFIFHLAAQSLVLPSYHNPLLTYHTNVIGTANVLEAIRLIKRPVTAIIITSDKCYLNISEVPAREVDNLGGKDPYSASKACAEIIFDSYRRGFFADSSEIKIASARAGNVIGGGDWADNRLLPDCVRFWESKSPAIIRSPDAIRPWQYVLDIINSYMILAEKTYSGMAQDENGAWNFGPDEPAWKVIDVVNEFSRHYSAHCGITLSDSSCSGKEAWALMLNVDKAKNNLGIRNKLSTQEAIAETAKWYNNANKHQATLDALERFSK